MSPPTNPHKKLFWIAAAAFLIRLFCLIFLRTYWFKEAGFGSGFEAGMISRSLAQGHGFASPFGGDTGPTAWLAPLYPALQALVFKFFGIDSLASAFVMRLINCFTAPVMCVLLYRIAARIWSERVGLALAIVWAIFPNSVYADTVVAWTTMLATMLLFMAVELVIVRPEDPRADVKAGGLSGVMALLDPSLLTAVGICWLWRWGHMPRNRVRSIAVTCLIAAAFTLPWSVRNYLVFGKPVFLRSNFGHELFKGNHLGGEGQNDWSLNPYNNPVEFQRYAALGELGYVADHKQQSMAAIEKYPGWFFKLFRRRMDAFWNGPLGISGMITFEGHEREKKIVYSTLSIVGLTGLLLALFRREPFAYLFATIIVVYPLIYYITFPGVRYRYPLEPILLMYTLYLVRLVIGRLRRREVKEERHSLEAVPVAT